MLKSIPPKFVDGVVKLHMQLNAAYNKAKDMYFSLMEACENEAHESRNVIHIAVDFSNQSFTHKLCGYFVFNHAIIRFLPIEFDTALLFEVFNHGGGEFKANGVSYEDILEFKLNRKLILFKFVPVSTSNSPLYSIFKRDFLRSYQATIDDIGMPVNCFHDIKYLNICDIPRKFLETQYTLVGTQYYAPYTISKAYCVLFAELDNEYDKNAIKIFRWFPKVKNTQQLDETTSFTLRVSDIFFEMGYISRNENCDLHSFMVDNNSRLLFGIKHENKISILGGVKMFQQSNEKYPKCLYNLVLK